MDPRDHGPVCQNLRLDRGKLGGAGSPRLRAGVAGKREERIAMTHFGGREARVELLVARIGERLREQLEAFGAAAFDHREHEQPIEQSRGLALANVLAQRSGVVVAEVVRGWLLAARHELRDLNDVARFVVREPRHRGHDVGALGVAADERQRGLGGFALAVQMIGVDRIEVRERDVDPARIRRHER